MKTCIVTTVAACLLSVGCIPEYPQYTVPLKDAGPAANAVADAAVDGGATAADGGEPGKPGSGAADGSTSPQSGDSAAPSGSPWVNVTNNLFTLAADGGEVSVISAAPGSGRVIAGLGNDTGLFVTEDGGETWVALGTGAGSDSIENGPSAVVYDPVNLATWWEVGIYGSGFGVYKTTDDGLTFSHLGVIHHDDLLSVDFTDPSRLTMLASGHEAKILWLSMDGGATWSDISPHLPSDSSYAPWPLVIDAHTFLVGSCGANGVCAVFRSEDRGDSWMLVTAHGPFGRPLMAKDGTLYWVLASDAGMITSTDVGKSWTLAGPGPVQMYYGASPVELPDGRVVTLGHDRLLATSDKGKTWTAIGAALPFPGANCGIYGFTYSASRKEFFLNHNDCSGHIIDNAIFRAAFDYASE